MLRLPQEAFNTVAEKSASLLQFVQHNAIPLQEWEVDELQACQKVAKHNLMASRLLEASFSSEESAQHTGAWEFKLHSHFPTLQIKRR